MKKDPFLETLDLKHCGRQCCDTPGCYKGAAGLNGFVNVETCHACNQFANAIEAAQYYFEDVVASNDGCQTHREVSTPGICIGRDSVIIDGCHYLVYAKNRKATPGKFAFEVI
jgi:hypothetical protein